MELHPIRKKANEIVIQKIINLIENKKKIIGNDKENLEFKKSAYELLSRHPNLTIEIIEKNINKPWVWGYKGISNNPNLTIEFINKYPDKPWDKNYFLKNSIHINEFIDKNSNNLSSWDFSWISYNSNITMVTIEKYIDKDWDW